jgi:hypothetical protein
MALQLPALRSIGDSIGLDFSSAVEQQSGAPVIERKKGRDADRNDK